MIRGGRAVLTSSMAWVSFRSHGLSPRHLRLAPNLFVHPPADLRNVLLPPSSRPARLLRLTVVCPASSGDGSSIEHSRLSMKNVLCTGFSGFRWPL